MTNFGFVQFPEDWSSPEFLEFSLYKEHSRVVRYVCALQSRRFDLYAPRLLVSNLSPDMVPPKLLAAIGRAPAKKESIGFTTAIRPPIVEFDLCEYHFSEEKANSFRYNNNFEGNTYSLYVPKEIFHCQPHPSRIYLKLAIPYEEA
jgi:hypothetical protein